MERITIASKEKVKTFIELERAKYELFKKVEPILNGWVGKSLSSRLARAIEKAYPGVLARAYPHYSWFELGVWHPRFCNRGNNHGIVEVADSITFNLGYAPIKTLESDRLFLELRRFDHYPKELEEYERTLEEYDERVRDFNTAAEAFDKATDRLSCIRYAE